MTTRDTDEIYCTCLATLNKSVILLMPHLCFPIYEMKEDSWFFCRTLHHDPWDLDEYGKGEPRT